MKVAIIGGTGFVGCYLVNSLVEKGDSVSLLVRPGSENKVIVSNQIRTVLADASRRFSYSCSAFGLD